MFDLFGDQINLAHERTRNHRSYARLEKWFRKHGYMARYKIAIKSAEKRHILFDLSTDDFREIIEKPCFYCDGELGAVKYGSGLDRIDNSKGYVKDNLISACGVCNKTRNNNFSVEECRAMIQALLGYRAKHGPC